MREIDVMLKQVTAEEVEETMRILAEPGAPRAKAHGPDPAPAKQSGDAAATAREVEHAV